MNSKLPETPENLEKAKHIFASLDVSKDLREAVAHAARDNLFSVIAFADILKAISAPERHADLLEKISGNIRARRQMGVALKSLSAGHNPVQAAAASGLLMSREGDDFSMKLTFSARGDGAAYLEITLGIFYEMDMDNPDEHLYCLFSEGVCMRKLPEFVSRKTVLLLGADDVMISAFQDHKAEFFIR